MIKVEHLYKTFGELKALHDINLEIDEGEIGIFIVAGEGFVKEYRRDGLHSHNPKYKTIHPSQDDNFRCVGRVLDVITEDMLATPRELAVLNEAYASKRDN